VKRYVSYKIDEQGNYINLPNIITKNVVAKINVDSNVWKLTDEFVLDYDTTHDNIYVGLEDIRVFAHNDQVFLMPTADYPLSKLPLNMDL